MYPIDFYYAVMLELERQHKIKQEHKYLHQAAARSQTKDKFSQKMAHWLGTQMITWGSKLQNINTASPAEIAVNTRLTR